MFCLPNIEAHTNGMQDKIKTATKVLHGLIDQFFHILSTADIAGDNRRLDLFSQFVDLSHAQRHGRIGKHQLRTSSKQRIAVIQAIDFSSRAPKMIPL